MTTPDIVVQVLVNLVGEVQRCMNTEEFQNEVDRVQDDCDAN